LRLSRAQQAKQLMPVHTRHVDVADDQVERLGFDRRQGFFRRTDGFVIMPGEQERIGQRFTQRAVIFDQQNLDTHDLHSAP
jgi:hypothetical protein